MTARVPARTAVPPSDQPRTQLAGFRVLCEQVAHRDLSAPQDLHDFSVSHHRDFWRLLLDWSDLSWEGAAEPVCTSDDVEHATFFPGVRLNYAENLLRPLSTAGDEAPAITSVHQDGRSECLTRGQLRDAVQRTAAALQAGGVGVGDRVVLVAPNSAAAAIAAVAVAGIGATLSTATPDMGPSALTGRFAQVEPRILLVDRTMMGRAERSADELLAVLVEALPTVEHVLCMDDGPLPSLSGTVVVARLADLVTAVPEGAGPPAWPRLPFDHPLWVMFSSGTTGPPKAMVHGAGGSLLEHVKEHRLHGDLRAGDTLYFHTTTAWMMWNWQLSALAVGAHIVLYDGAVAGPATLWELVARHGVTVFGTSPAYLQLCQDEGYRPKDALDLRALRSVLSTGSVLHDWQYRWVADAVADVPVQSISGGTDIVGCFLLGHPEAPVRPGRCQSLSLGLDVAAVDEAGREVVDEVGELVCRRPFPSRPVGFLGDPDGQRFHRAYFADHPGVWTHGDRVEIAADGSARVHGRSDGVLNVDGVRIGPSEIYSIVRRLPEVADAMAVELPDRDRPGSSRLALLVVLRGSAVLDDALAARIRSTLRREGSAAHVPSLVLDVPQLPMTHNGKKSERAARDALCGLPAVNTGALRNPSSIAEIADAAHRAERALEEPSAAEGLGDVQGDDVQGKVAHAFRDVLGVPVDETTDFFDAGGTSRQSMTLLRRLRIETGREVSLEDFLVEPTIRGVSAAVRAAAEGTAAVSLLRAGDPALPGLYLVHGAYGDADSHWSLVEHLDTPRPVYGLGGVLNDADGVILSLAEIADADVERLAAAQPTGPLYLAGYSFGGLVAYEMARRFAGRGREVAFLGLLDVVPPQRSLTGAERVAKKAAGALALLVPGLSNRTLRQGLTGAFRDLTLPAEERALQDATESYESHRWGPYAGRVTYFRATRCIPVFGHLMHTWRRVAPDMEVIDVPCTHHDMLGAERAPAVGRAMSSALARCEAATVSTRA